MDDDERETRSARVQVRGIPGRVREVSPVKIGEATGKMTGEFSLTLANTTVQNNHSFY
jgi:hypothetical protein